MISYQSTKLEDTIEELLTRIDVTAPDALDMFYIAEALDIKLTTLALLARITHSKH